MRVSLLVAAATLGLFSLGCEKKTDSTAKPADPKPTEVKPVVEAKPSDSDVILLGEVGSTSKAAFRTLVGRHDLCVLPATSKARCGDPGTLRKTFIHDGWQLAMRCD